MTILPVVFLFSCLQSNDYNYQLSLAGSCVHNHHVSFSFCFSQETKLTSIFVVVGWFLANVLTAEFTSLISVSAFACLYVQLARHARYIFVSAWDWESESVVVRSSCFF